MAKLIDPLLALKEDREQSGEKSSGQFIRASLGPLQTPPVMLPTGLPPKAPPIKELPEGATMEERIKADFRVFLTLVWRHLLGNDPNPIQLDLAYWLQHGPDRAIIMAFRGFSKSWITGAYALWRLYCDPDEKVMVVSGGLVRAMATSNWCLGLVMTMDILAHMRPKGNNRQSAQMWDVGNCIPAQSASFTAFGIGGQLVGFRGSLIIPDDVETQTNSLTVVMREKIRDSVKEFESVLTPGGQIKYLGTPHDVDSLYMYLLSLKNNDGTYVYSARVWTARYPTEEEVGKYGGRLAPYLIAMIKKLGPSCIGHSTMPMRFPDSDLDKREAAMGKAEFRLQFLLDLSGMSVDKYPLKLRDLMVMEMDKDKLPEELVWGNITRHGTLPVMGFDGDYYHKPNFIGSYWTKPSKTIGYLDGSGRGADETALAIGSELHGRAFLRRLWASRDGYSEATLKDIAQQCVRFRVSTLYVETNFGDGMLNALLRPVITKAWEDALKSAKKKDLDGLAGTDLEEVKSGRVEKERRILSVMEPVCQAHRLVIDKSVIEWDYESINQIDGEDNRRYYSFAYQFTHLTREKDCLGHDDRLEAVAGMLAMFASELEVEPEGMTIRAKEDREDELLRELEEDEDAIMAGRVGGSGERYGAGRSDSKAQAAKATRR